MNPGTSLWAIKQLLDGKKITLRNWRDCDYIHLVDNKIVDFEGTPFPIREFDTDRYTWQLWNPPVNYPAGTFAWAVEQMKQEKVVQHNQLKYRFYCECFQEFSAHIGWYEVVFDTSEILSTRWELV